MSALAAPRERALHLEMIDAVLAGGGVAPVAAIAAAQLGGSVAVVIPSADVEVVEPPIRSSIATYVADRLLGRPAKVPGGLVAEVPVRSGDETLGYVALLGTGPAPGAQEVLELAALAALTAVALRDANVTRRRASAVLLDELRGPRPITPDELLARAARLGADLSGGATALCLRPASERALAAIAQELPGTLAAVREGIVEALVPGPADRAAVQRLARGYDVGLSPFEPDPGKLAAALRFATIALELDGDVREGSWRLLIAAGGEELKAVVASTIGGLDETLRETLRSYLEHGASLKSTAAAVYAHRHTVSNRLERVHAITGHDPHAPTGQAQLLLGLQAREVLRVLIPHRVGGHSLSW